MALCSALVAFAVCERAGAVARLPCFERPGKAQQREHGAAIQVRAALGVFDGAQSGRWGGADGKGKSHDCEKRRAALNLSLKWWGA